MKKTEKIRTGVTVTHESDKFGKTTTYEFDVEPLKIKGNNSSLWGNSNGTYEVTKVIFEMTEDEDSYYGTLELFGKNTLWTHYTDRAIEKQVEKHFKKIIKEKCKVNVKAIGWSEQGMQPNEGWNFDVVLKGKK